MNKLDSHIIVTKEEVPKNHFPIMAQLGVLGLIMLILYGSWLFQPDNNQAEDSSLRQIIITDEERYPLIPQKIENISLSAEAAYVWDIKGQRSLYSKNSDLALPLASITKLMTALLAYELVSGEETFPVPISAIRQEGSSGLVAGEVLGLEALSELSLVSSSNDAAYAMGASVGSLLGDRDPLSQFVAGMNIRANELGLYTLKFSNTTGLDESKTEPGAAGSAKDISFLMEYIIRNYPEIISPTKEEEAVIYNTAGSYHLAGNTNEVVMKIPNILGSKTGYTDLAGGNLTIVFDAGLDRPIVVTVLGSTRDNRFTDVLALIEAVQVSLSKQ
jgi:D-alanyl-D-alanine carboxypeptidase (penicillin-binding protein 5/6)